MEREVKYIESKENVKDYLSKLRYALANGANINFQEVRIVDENRNIRHTNKYTVAELFPNQNPVDVLRTELKKLTVEEYLCTVKDLRFPKRADMRVFGKTYSAEEEVYIKIRVELANVMSFGNHTTFVMSFHFAEKPFSAEDFPYHK